MVEAYNSDIFNSVTKDKKHVYVKLINADNIEKVTKLNLKDLKVAKTGKIIILSGESSLVHIPNVNRKNEEVIVPKEYKIELKNEAAIITLPANSVNILILDI